MRRSLIFGGALVLVIVALIASRGPSFDEMGERRFAALERSDELVVGVSWPFASGTDGMDEGVRLARDRINDENLTGGPKVRLVERDDGDAWETARRVALDFAADPKMSAVIGYDDDSVAIRASPIFESARLLHILVNVNSPAITQHDFKYVIRSVQTTNQIAGFLAKLKFSGDKPERFAVVWQDDAFGRDLLYEYLIKKEEFNGHAVYQWPFALDRYDFREPINRLKSADVDQVLFWGYDDAVVDFLKTAKSIGLTKRIVVATDLSDEIRTRAGKAIDGVSFLSLYEPTSDTPENLDFVSRYRSRFGRDPDTFAAQGYDALMMLAAAVKGTGSLNPLDLSFHLRFMPEWRGANGSYSYGADGEMRDKPLRLIVGRAD